MRKGFRGYPHKSMFSINTYWSLECWDITVPFLDRTPAAGSIYWEQVADGTFYLLVLVFDFGRISCWSELGRQKWRACSHSWKIHRCFWSIFHFAHTIWCIFWCIFFKNTAWYNMCRIHIHRGALLFFLHMYFNLRGVKLHTVWELWRVRYFQPKSISRGLWPCNCAPMLTLKFSIFQFCLGTEE